MEQESFIRYPAASCNPASFYGIVTSRSHEGIYFPVAVTDLLYIIPGRKSNWKKSFCGACYDGIVYNGTLSFGRYIQTVGNGRSCRYGIHSSGISGIV